ncbi:DUF2490 domain-containing protein [Christiangramia sediminis]|uniref:DUF2490 domain-containing protein n=1 Tax=Christiangramia sediminis TaxID=2881336 RepID=A0A9X1LJU3_9FLAO|nr:DUF2490 domain-containing protein [Christiangramia sediminis]MCB7481663.1 DUF2490 domain-containing protein [Christiangramia sediminis]
MTIFSSKKFLLLPFLLLSGLLFSQEDFSVYAEPEFSLNIESDSRWSYNFGVGNRNLILQNETDQLRVQHLELSQFTSYEVGFYSKLSLGLRYRFREVFEDSREDEIRITQQYGRSRKFNRVKIAHRIRFEERFREQTSFRSRYEFSVEFPLSGDRVDEKEFFMVTNTEALWSMGKQQKPSFEHRFGISVGNELFRNTKLDIGLEYRLDDYTQATTHELFILTGINLSI